MSDHTDWASLAPELLALVLQRVEDAAGERGEGRRVVALAGVCRSWRTLLQQEWQPRTSLIHFPPCVRQTAPKDSHLQCLLKKKGDTFTLFQTLPAAADECRQEYFLLAARKQFAFLKCKFKISTAPRRFSAKKGGGGGGGAAAGGYGHTAATLTSNFWRSKFSLLERRSAREEDSSPQSSLSMEFQEMLVRGACQRKICCTIHPLAKTESQSDRPWKELQVTKPSFRWRCLSNLNSQVSHFSAPEIVATPGLEKSTPVITEEQREPEADGSRSICDPSKGATLTNKVPAWDERHQCWALDFKGRATRASIHNFQLISATNSVLSSEEAADPAAESVILQLGKVGKGVYILDFCAPLSPLQAFSICLSSFATGVGLEP